MFRKTMFAAITTAALAAVALTIPTTATAQNGRPGRQPVKQQPVTQAPVTPPPGTQPPTGTKPPGSSGQPGQPGQGQGQSGQLGQPGQGQSGQASGTQGQSAPAGGQGKCPLRPTLPTRPGSGSQSGGQFGIGGGLGGGGYSDNSNRINQTVPANTRGTRPDGLVGTWRLYTDLGVVDLRLLPDGTYVFAGQGRSFPEGGITGTWFNVNGRLYLPMGEGVAAWNMFPIGVDINRGGVATLFNPGDEKNSTWRKVR